MNYDKLIQNINPPDSTAPFRLWDEVGYIVPWQDIKNIVKNGSDVNFDTVGTAFMVRDRRRNPFKGTNIDYVEGEHGSVTFKETVVFPALTNSVENATIANALANCGRFVLILKNYDYQADGKGKYQVFGIDGGLKLEGEPFDPYADAAWNITLTSERVAQSAVYIWDTDEATTDAKYSLIAEYEVITGLSLADGSVTPQVVYLQVDNDKTCKVVLPDGTILTSTAGVINTTWTGAAGAVTLIVPKNTAKLILTTADFVGELSTETKNEIQTDECPNITAIEAPLSDNVACINCTSLTTLSTPMATDLECYDCASLTTLSTPMATDLECYDCASLTTLSTPNATTIYASGCALTAVAIAAQVRATVLNIADLSTVSFDFSGDTNANYATLSAQAQSDIQAIITAGGTVTYNA